MNCATATATAATAAAMKLLLVGLSRIWLVVRVSEESESGCHINLTSDQS